MKITIVDLRPPRGVPASRTFEATDLINTNISQFLPDLRARIFLAEVKKLLLYSRYDAAFLPWDDNKLDQFEVQIDTGDIQACFPHRWNVVRPLSARVAVKAIEQAMLDGLKEMRFYVDWYPFSLTANALEAAHVAEERVAQFISPYRYQVSCKSRQAVQTVRKLSCRLPWVRQAKKSIERF